MAPRPPSSPQLLIAKLRDPKTKYPLLLGSPSLAAGVGVVREKPWFGKPRFELRRLVRDAAASDAFVARKLAAGEPLAPEEGDAFWHPTGELLAQGASLEAFIEALARVRWERTW